MAPLDQRLTEIRERVQSRYDETRRQVLQSIRFTRGTLKATRTMLVGVGLIDEKKAKRVRYIPFQVFWLLWWVLFAVGFFLPTYVQEPYLVFPSVLALAVVWLFGMAQFAQTLLGTDLRDLKLTPEGWLILLRSYQEAGTEVAQESMTAESAQTAAKELESWLPGMARQSVLDLTSFAALQAVLAGCVATIGLFAGPSLANVHWWHGWSPVVLLYAASLPIGLSLLFYGLVPFIVSRFLAALRLHREAAPPEVDNRPASTAKETPTPRRRASRKAPSAAPRYLDSD